MLSQMTLMIQDQMLHTSVHRWVIIMLQVELLVADLINLWCQIFHLLWNSLLFSKIIFMITCLIILIFQAACLKYPMKMVSRMQNITQSMKKRKPNAEERRKNKSLENFRSKLKRMLKLKSRLYRNNKSSKK